MFHVGGLTVNCRLRTIKALFFWVCFVLLSLFCSLCALSHIYLFLYLLLFFAQLENSCIEDWVNSLVVKRFLNCYFTIYKSKWILQNAVVRVIKQTNAFVFWCDADSFAGCKFVCASELQSITNVYQYESTPSLYFQLKCYFWLLNYDITRYNFITFMFRK